MAYKINLCDENSCTQCFACEQVCPRSCITRKEADAGFFVPEINRDICIGCGACMKACHKINQDRLEYQRPDHAYACWTTDIQDREHSSSGGAFSALARQIFNDRGVVFGCTMDENLKVRHIAIERDEDIGLLQGSKYVQSDMGGVYGLCRDYLKAGRKVLFTGTPCQIGGLYTFLKDKPENLYTCDVVCHGVPSQKSFDIYVDKMGLREGVREIGFRFTKGWGFQMSRHLVSPAQGGDSKKKLIPPAKGYYLRAFSSGLMFGESCYNCPYARPERVSDITIADFWGLGTMLPFSHPVYKGVSMMLVNNSHGLNLIESCGLLYREERPIGEAVRGNGNLERPSQRPAGRDSYYDDSRRMNARDLQRKYGIRASARDYLRIVKQYINSLK